MLRSMYSGIGGLRNFQTKLDVIGNNIANVNTFGYKKGRVTFKDMVSQSLSGAGAATANRGGTNPMQVGLGSSLGSIDNIHTQGSIQSTGRPLDLGISGDGYFVVNRGGQEFYTRSGNFYLDNNGTLVTADGMKVQGYSLDESGNVTNNLGDITVSTSAVMPTTQTANLALEGNLPTSAGVGSSMTQEIKVVSTTGEEHAVEVLYVATDTPDVWNIYMGKAAEDYRADPMTAADPTTGATETLQVDLSATPPTSTPNPLPAGFDLDDDGGTTNDILGEIAIDVSALTNNGNSINVAAKTDGYTQGFLESFNIGSGGEINGVFSNGQVLTLANLAIANFSNTGGLSKAGNNLFQASINSGPANVGLPGDGRGTVAGSALEMSNVDLSEEFTEMIVAQRGFQANTRIITTSDEILQELVNLKR